MILNVLTIYINLIEDPGACSQIIYHIVILLYFIF